MKILLIHEHGKAHGPGAVVAMYQLHRNLIALGHKSTIACRRKQLDEDEIVLLPESEKLESLLNKFTWRMGFNDIHCVSSFKIADFPPFLEADVVNIHGWHSNYFSYLAVPKLARIKPLVSTLHDMWPLTGHCAQSFDCQRWKTGCGKCPYPEAYPAVQHDLTAIEWKLKRRVYRKVDGSMSVVAPSKWMCDMARESMLGHLPIHQVPNGIDESIYYPRDKAAARAEFGIQKDRPVIMFIAASLANRMKGSDLFIEAMRVMKESVRRDAILLLVGDQADVIAQTVNMEYVAPGYISDENLKAMAYSAADICVMPSRAETQGIVLMESMACGTPVASFNSGGMGEVVEKGPGGLLAEHENAQQLAENIARMIEDPALRKSLASTGRAAVQKHYTTRRTAEMYVDVFQQTIDAYAPDGAAHTAAASPSA